MRKDEFASFEDEVRGSSRLEDESGLVMKEFLEEFFEDSEEFSGVILKRFTTGSVTTGEEENKTSWD